VKRLALLLLVLPGCALFRGKPLEVEYVETVTESGVRWKDTLTGVGKCAGPKDRVTIHYTAEVHGGESIDSTYDRGLPETFYLTAAPVLGWADGIPGMRVGGRRWIFVPPHRAFGNDGIEGLIPPRASLEFEVELLKVEAP